MWQWRFSQQELENHLEVGSQLRRLKGTDTIQITLGTRSTYQVVSYYLNGTWKLHKIE